MSKHTPGPLAVHFVCDETVVTDRLARWIAIVRPSAPEYEANARLIAAAYNSYDKHCGPRAVECAEGDLLGELLEACKAIAAYEGFVGPRLDAIIKQAEAAIAKAEGGAK